jgi:hypothetical protein
MLRGVNQMFQYQPPRGSSAEFCWVTGAFSDRIPGAAPLSRSVVNGSPATHPRPRGRQTGGLAEQAYEHWRAEGARAVSSQCLTNLSAHSNQTT